MCGAASVVLSGASKVGDTASEFGSGWCVCEVSVVSMTGCTNWTVSCPLWCPRLEGSVCPVETGFGPDGLSERPDSLLIVGVLAAVVSVLGCCVNSTELEDDVVTVVSVSGDSKCTPGMALELMVTVASCRGCDGPVCGVHSCCSFGDYGDACVVSVELTVGCTASVGEYSDADVLGIMYGVHCLGSVVVWWSAEVSGRVCFGVWGCVLVDDGCGYCSCSFCGFGCVW